MWCAHNVKGMLKWTLRHTTYPIISYICNAFQKCLALKKSMTIRWTSNGGESHKRKMTQREILRCSCDLWKPGKTERKERQKQQCKNAWRPVLPQWGELLRWRQKETLGTRKMLDRSAMSTEERWKRYWKVSINKWVSENHERDGRNEGPTVNEPVALSSERRVRKSRPVPIGRLVWNQETRRKR